MRHADIPYFPPAKTRTHEVCGAGGVVFAFALAARLAGNALWVRETWQSSQINPHGFSGFVAPSELTVCNSKDQTESLAVSEEALRSGAVSLVVMQLSQPLGLTEGRRLQLAARDGDATGLALIPEGMGSNAVETRWRCTPVFDQSTSAQDSTLQHWELIKNKSGTLGAWHVRWDAASRRINVVSPPRQ